MKNRTLKSFASLVAAAGLYCCAATAGTYKNITIDGSFGDWSGVPLLHTDPQDSPTQVDYEDFYVANDENYLYIRFTVYSAANPFTFLQNFYIDTDNDGLTGYGAGGYVGSELLIQEGAGYQQKPGVFNAGGVNGLGWSAAPTGNATEFEVRISRSATYASDGAPVFTNDTIAFVLDAENSSFTPVEWAPNVVGGLAYTFELPPSPLTTNLSLISFTDPWQANDAGADLGVAWLDPFYDDTAAGWTTGTGLFGYTPNPGSYPSINTALASGANTYYFRTHFNWSYLSDNIAFIVTNYLSDGAVIYLNGAEVRRVRMPAGTIGFDTSATGSASPEGQAEVYGISGQSLILGDNILEVETHQASGGGADMVFGLSLTAAAEFPVFNVNTNLPEDQSVVAGDPVTLTSDVIGSGPLAYQWSKDGVDLPWGTNAHLSIPVALTNDAGDYVLVTTNAFGTNITRTALLTVTSTPVTFDDPAQPADAYTLEGQDVTLGVTVSGSPLFEYQWYKENDPIADATNASYTIVNPALTNSGNYRVTVSNPSGSTNSRTAVVTVLADTVPASISAVTASSTQITVTFSAPVDSATANDAGNYTLSGGLTVNNAEINAGNATQVILTTSGAMTFGTVYQLTVDGVTDLFGNATSSIASFARTISIDGSFDDWEGIAPVFSGPIGMAGAADFKDIYVYSDASRYYFRVTLWQDLPPESGRFPDYVNMFFDTDNDAATGFSVFGSELLIQSGFGYQEKNGGFNEGSIENLNWTCLPSVPGTNFEFSISRAATYTSDGALVFPTNVLNFLFQGMDPSFIPLNQAPESGVITFTDTPIVNVPALPLGSLAIQSVADGKVAVAWDEPGTLQTIDSFDGGSWTNIPAATSPYVIPAAGTQLFFQLTN